jgi:ankyrin repeat protein
LNGFSKTKDSRMSSNIFYIAGAPWVLAVYPKGKQVSQTLSIYLKIIPPSAQPHYASSYAPPSVSRDVAPENDEIPSDTVQNVISDRTSAASPTPVSSSSSAPPATGSLQSTGNAPSTSTAAAVSDPHAWSYVVNFRISLLNQLDGSKFTRSVDAKIFKHKCEDWGFPQFIKLSTLLNPESGFLDDDAILLEVALEVVECVRPQALPTRHLVSTFPSTPSHLRPTSPVGPPHTGSHLPTSSQSSATVVPIGALAAASFSIPLRKPHSKRIYKPGVDWQVDTPIKNQLNFMPLHWAVFCGSLEAVTELLARQADIDSVDANGRTPLDWACYYGHYDLVKLLVAHNASGKVRDHEHAKPIHKAAFLGSPDIIQLMLHHFKNLDADLAPLDKRRKASLGSDTESDRLVSAPPLARDELHLSGVIDSAVPSSSDTGALQHPPSPRTSHLTSSKDSSNSKESSIMGASDLDGLTSSQQEPCASDGDEPVSSLKTETGGLLPLQDNALASEHHPPHQKDHHRQKSSGSSGDANHHIREGSAHTKHHQPSHSLQLIQSGSTADSSSRRRSSDAPNTQLASMAHTGSQVAHQTDGTITITPTVGFSSIGGSSGNETTSSAGRGNGFTSGSGSASAPNFPLAMHTPLQQCLRTHRIGLAEQLVEDFDGDVNVVDLWGRSPLHLAAYSGDINLLELFLSRSHPRLINHQDKDGFTPLHKAIARGYFDCVQVLLNADADIGIASKSGYTPFHYAVLLNELQCAKMILEFDPRRGTAPVPLREHLEAARRSSDVVDSDVPLLPLEREKKRATVSISDTIQLMRPDSHPTANPSSSTAASSASSSANSTLHHSNVHLLNPGTGPNSHSQAPTLHRPPVERPAAAPPLGILHHPPGSEAAIAKQRIQLKRHRATNSDEELFEQKDSVVAVDEVLSSSPSSSKIPPRRRSVNFHGDNAVVRIKQHNTEEPDETLLDHDHAPGISNPGHTGSFTPHRKTIEESGSSSDEDSSSGQNGKFEDLEGALSADSEDNEEIGDEEFSKSKSRKRSHTIGNERPSARNIIKRHLSDDDSGYRGRFYVDVHSLRIDEDTDVEEEEEDDDDDAGPEESSESLSLQMHASTPLSFKHDRSSREREHVHRRGRSLTRLKDPNAHIFGQHAATSSLASPTSLLESGMIRTSSTSDATEAQRQQDVNLDQTPSSARKLQNNTDITTSSRKTMFGSSRSRSTGAFEDQILQGSPGSPPPGSGQPQPSSVLVASADLPKPRSSKLSGILKAFSSKTSESTSAASATLPVNPISAHTSSHANSGASSDSEGARLKRARIRRASSSSSLESAHSVITQKKNHQTGSGGERIATTTPASPPNSPPMSPTHPPLKGSSKISLSQGSAPTQTHTTARFEESTSPNVRRSQKSRSPPPAGRRPKSGSISTADRDQVLSLTSPRQTSPRPLMASSGPSSSKSISSAVVDTNSSSAAHTSSINEGPHSARHAKSPSDGASVEGKSWELHRHSERYLNERHADKTPVEKMSDRLGEKSKEHSSENVTEKAVESSKNQLDALSTNSAVPSSDSGIAPVYSTPSIVTSQKKRSRSGKTGKSDLRVQINLMQQGSPLASPLSPVTGGTSSREGVSFGSDTHQAPIYTAQEILSVGDANGWLPLHTSVKQSNVKMAQYILSKGASVLELANGMSVLDLAIQNQDATLATLLLDYGAPIMDAGPALQSFVGQKIILARNLDMAPAIPQSTFFGDMRALLNNSQFYDVTFMVEGKPVYGWKGLLATRCEVFRAMFTGALREANEANITISDVSYHSFYRIIEFIYTDSITSDKMTLDDALQLLAAANRYMLDRLKRIVERWLLSQLTHSNVAAIFHAADLYQAHHLRSSCILYVSTHLHRIPELFDLLNGTFRGVLLDFLQHPAASSSGPA